MRAWDKMSNEQLLAIWEVFETQSWCDSDMYDKTTSMYELEMIISSEMDSRGLNKLFCGNKIN